ncbi:hypothetical protein F511_40403 [Dorcoceras hygrometricum]|uniref:Uncharacterized protein n=1 Tax=Dorcoceras hygrometricum TaxID=472368 RepID=A0A2Z7ARJ1_9LAMI|nr:hypothetical protein F511_40403 [Dorcoceras hygrometricum]
MRSVVASHGPGSNPRGNTTCNAILLQCFRFYRSSVFNILDRHCPPSSDVLPLNLAQKSQNSKIDQNGPDIVYRPENFTGCPRQARKLHGLPGTGPNQTLEEFNRHDIAGASSERRPPAAAPQEIFARQPRDVAPSVTHGRAQGAALNAHRPASSGALHVPSSPTSAQQASPEQTSQRDRRAISSRETAPSVTQLCATKGGQRAGSRVRRPRRAKSARRSGRSPSATGELRASMRKRRPSLTQNCATLAQKSGVVGRPLQDKRAAVCARACEEGGAVSFS